LETDERWKRPKPERTQPVRNWSTMFAAPTGSEPANGSGSATNQSTDPVSRAVELGYRVIDEYIRQGQTAARRFSEGGLSVGGVTAGWQDAATRMAQLTGEWMGLWIELAQRAAGASGLSDGMFTPRQPGGAGEARESERNEPGQATSAGASVRLRVKSLQPVEVAVDIRPDCVHVPLVVHSLRAVDSTLPRIDDVAFSPATASSAAVLSIHLPPDQPRATYSAVLIDTRTNRPAGTVSVTVVD